MMETLGPLLDAWDRGDRRFTPFDLAHWAPGAAEWLEGRGLLTMTRSGDRAFCPGCEESCIVRPRQIRGEPVHFCTGREDVNVVPIPPHAFNRWSLSASGLAAEIARSLATEKQLRVAAPGVWLVGRLHTGKTRVPVFFWPGLARLDPVDRAARVQSMHPSRYVILVPSVVPDDMDDERAVVFSLASILDVDNGDLSIAGDDLVAPFLETRAAQVRRFPLLPGTTWEAITIRFVSDDDVQIVACGRTETRDYAEMGMRDQRTKGHNESWVFLRMLAARKGTTKPSDGPPDEYQRTKVTRLRKPLRAVFGLMDNPFHPYRPDVGWVLRLNLKDARGTA